MRNRSGLLQKFLFSTALAASATATQGQGCHTNLPLPTSHLPDSDLVTYLAEDFAESLNPEFQRFNDIYTPTQSGFTSFVVPNEQPSAIATPGILQVGNSDWDSVGSEVLDNYTDNVVEKKTFLEFPQLRDIKDYNVTKMELILTLKGPTQNNGDFLAAIRPISQGFDENTLTIYSEPSPYRVTGGAETRWLDWMNDGSSADFPRTFFTRPQRTAGQQMVFDLTNLECTDEVTTWKLVEKLERVRGFLIIGPGFHRSEDYGYNLTRENFRTFERTGPTAPRLEVSYQNYEEL